MYNPFVIYLHTEKKVKMVFFNVDDIIARSLSKFGIVNDVSSENVNLDQFLTNATNIGSLLGQVRVAYFK